MSSVGLTVPPRGLGRAALGLSVLGLLFSIYLTYEHYDENASLLCSDSGAVNCAKVTTSSWSSLLGVPVALLGLVFFVVMTMLCLPKLWSNTSRALGLTRLVLSVGSLAFVLYLVWAEFFRINAICMWCTFVHIVSLLLMLVIVAAEVMREPVREPHRAA